MESLLNHILEHLPEAPPWFDKEQLTDKSLRFFASEIIREKIFRNYAQEIPYCTEVEVEEFRETQERYSIRAIIYVMRDSQKGILIGNKGSALKKTGTQARLDMEDFFQKSVYLELYVKVLPNWRDSRSRLRQFGY
jgi:GTP-binding protein Era